MSQERRVRRSKAQESLPSELSEGIFTTLADALVFAASVGYEAQVRKSFDAAAESIRYGTFETRNVAHIIDLLAFAESGEVEILADSRLGDRIEVFEELAEGGMTQIAARRALEPNLLDTCLAFLAEEEQDSLEANILRELDGV